MENNINEAKRLWGLLGEVPVNENEETEEVFIFFKEGTCIYEIWDWFEEEFNISVAGDLMYTNKI